MPGKKYASTKMIKMIATKKMTVCFIVKRKRSDSFPTRPVAAAATAIDCGDIILPTTPPELFAATVKTGLTPICSAVTCCNLANKALEEVSEPVRKTPSQPRTGDKTVNNEPVDASKSPKV